MQSDFDVVIVGYGPVGATLANVLGRGGLSVAVVDQMTGIYDKPRAINIDQEVMRVLQSVGLAEAVDKVSSHHTGTEFRGLDDRLIKVFRPMAPPYPLGWAPNLMFIQPEFETILRDGVARFSNVAVWLGAEAVDHEQTAERVRVTLQDGSGTRAVSGRYLIACDGAGSPFRKRLGIAQESLDFDEWWTVIDAWLTGPADVPAVTTQFCQPDGPYTYVVGPRGLRRWEVKLLPGERPTDYDDLDAVRRRMSVFVDTSAIEIWRAATYRFHALVAREWRRGRIFLAGDAAHQTPPFMAQGLCSGIRDVANLAWKLVAVLQRGWPDSLLDTYEIERKPHIRDLVATTKELGLIIGELDIAKARSRDAALAGELAAGASETVRQKLIPDLVDGIVYKGGGHAPMPPAGTLAPQPRVFDGEGRSQLLDDLVGPAFLLVTLGPAPMAWLDEASAAALSRIGAARVVILSGSAARAADPFVLAEDGTLFADWMTTRNCAALIVRPDGYVYSGAADAPTLNRQIGRLEEDLFRGQADRPAVRRRA